MKRRDKQLVILLIILILLIVVCAFVVINIFRNSKSNKNTSKYTDSKINLEERIEGKYEANVINKEYLRLDNENIILLDNTIDYVVNNINNKDYAKIYEMTPEDYKILKYPNIEVFTEYIDNTFDNGPYTCISYRLYIDANYLKLKDASGEVFELKLCPFNAVDDTKIAFDKLEAMDMEFITSFNISKVFYTTRALVKYDDNMSVFFEVKNWNDKDVEVILENIKLSTVIRGVEENIISACYKKETIKAKETKIIEVPLNMVENIYLKIDSISVDVTTDGEKQSVKRYIDYYDDEL